MYHKEQGCTFPYKNTNFPLYFGQENRIFLVTRSVLWPKIYRKCDSGRGFAPDPAGGAHDAPPDPVVGWGADTPPHTPPHSTPRSSCPLTPNPGETLVTTTFKVKLRQCTPPETDTTRLSRDVARCMRIESATICETDNFS